MVELTHSSKKTLSMKKLLILLFSILISFNSYGETETYYYENGQIESEANYKDGKLDGKEKKITKMAKYCFN